LNPQDRQAQFEQRKAFQRLVYLSYIVFGDQKSAFLLPWRRVFNLTDAQLFVARRSNAQAIFSGYLAARGGELPAERQYLRELRDYQQQIKLFDESAEEIVREALRKQVEGWLQQAVDIARAPGRQRDPAAVVEVRTNLTAFAIVLAAAAAVSCVPQTCNRHAAVLLCSISRKSIPHADHGPPRHSDSSSMLHVHIRVRITLFFNCLQIVHKLLDYGRKMAKFANDDDLIPGLGLPSIHGGAWDVESK
jgi:hypothetical protein